MQWLADCGFNFAKLPVLESPVQVTRRLTLQHSGLRSATGCYACSSDYKQISASPGWQQLNATFESIRALVSGDEPGELKVRLCTVEDKDPSILWVAETRATFIRMYEQLRVSGRWALQPANASHVLAFYRQLYALHLPRSLQPRDNRLRMNGLPYTYGTIKHKCWGLGTGRISHTCKKIGHSCTRCINSFVSFPGRQHLQFATRALAFLIRQTWSTFAVENLAVSAEEFTTAIKHLEIPQRVGCNNCFGCKFCGEEFSAMSAFVGDAGQAFEVINVSAVREGVNALCDDAKKIGLPDSVQVTKARVPKVAFGGSIRTRFLDKLIYTRLALRQFVYSVLLMRTFRFAFIFVTQRSVAAYPQAGHGRAPF